MAGGARWQGANPPDYTAVFMDRQRRLPLLKANPEGAKEFYRTRPKEFITHWVTTFDPRLATSDLPARLPFVMFPRQEEMVDFLHACLMGEANGLIEKCRDAGATWVCCAFSVWIWLFLPGAAVGWGSRKEDLVDRIGDPKCIFDKIRMIVVGLPKELLPKGFNRKDHMPFMKVINPENGATIAGEAGDNIGRGGRTLVYFKDESAWYERPESIEAALGDKSPLNKDFFANLKAQAWWKLRRRFELTFRARNEPGFTWVADDLISLPADLPLLRQVEKELSQPVSAKDARMRLKVDKQPEGTRSPNLADAIVMAFCPITAGFDLNMWAALGQ